MRREEHLYFSYADYSEWNKIEFVSLGEFIYLAEGFDPSVRLHDRVVQQDEEAGCDNFYDDFNIDRLNDFKLLFKKIKRQGLDLPRESTKETEVRYRDSNIPLYEATYLIDWAKSKKLFVNKKYKPINSSKTKKTNPVFTESEILKNGLLDVRKIESTKLLLAIESYVLNMFGKNPDDIPKSTTVTNELVTKYGLTGSVARQIAECSNHDSKAKNPPTSARKKTIFWQEHN